MDHTNARRQIVPGAYPQSEPEQAQIICVIGGPGVGKGTQCARLVNDLHVSHLSVGDLLRDNAATILTEQGVDVIACMKRAKLCPKETVQAVVIEAIVSSIETGKTRILLDGFPRSMDQTRLFEASGCKIMAVVWFQGSKETLLARVLDRAETSGRVDDTRDVFEKRFQGFQDECGEIIHYFEQKGKLVKVDCDGSLPDTYIETLRTIERIFEGERNEGEGHETFHDCMSS